MDVEFIEAIGDLIQWSFGILRVLANNFNWLIIAVMAIMTVIWVRRMAGYNREAKQNGTLK